MATVRALETHPTTKSEAAASVHMSRPVLYDYLAKTERLRRVDLDNPASGRVLEKLGFEALGIVAPRLSCARGTEAPARMFALELAGAGRVEEVLAA